MSAAGSRIHVVLETPGQPVYLGSRGTDDSSPGGLANVGHVIALLRAHGDLVSTGVGVTAYLEGQATARRWRLHRTRPGTDPVITDPVITDPARHRCRTEHWLPCLIGESDQSC